MKHFYILTLLYTLFNGVFSSAQVPFITEDFTFITTRYSNFMGGFDEDCSITAPMVKLAPGENLCDLDSIQTDISGQVLITFIILNFDCFEEIAYENAIQLGAVAVIDAVGIPPGSFHSVHNVGQKFKQGDIPFLQVGTEFFATFGIQGFSPAFDFLVGTPISIDGCGDSSKIIECYDVYQGILIVFSFAAFSGVFLAYRAVKKVRWTATSRPRVVLIIYEAIFLFFTAVLLFFGLTLRQAKNWADGSIVSAQAKDVLGTLQIVGNVHGSLMNAIYWNALRKGCFVKESKTAAYWRKQFFLSPWQLVALGSSIFFFYELTRLFDNFYSGDVDDFEVFLRIVIWIDVLCGVILFLSMVYFIFTLRKILPNSRNQSVFSNGESCTNRLHFMWVTIKGVVKGETFSLRKGSPNSPNVSAVNSKLLNLSLHLLKWLSLYVVIMIISSSLLLLGFFENLPFGVLQDDPDGCKAFSFFFAYVCVKIFTSHCKIIGLAGPPGRRVTDTEISNRKYSPRLETSTGWKVSKMSSVATVPNEPRPASPVAEHSLQYEVPKREKRMARTFEPIVRKSSVDESILIPTEGRGVSILRKPTASFVSSKKKGSAVGLGSTFSQGNSSGRLRLEKTDMMKYTRKFSSDRKISV
eukprot:snap_masked-scaffold_12-processed-gene-3.21-mRNA-1 protein AED:1.00 eAED:1.00 QI:0/-1/0/0/-1/1/1/0/637